MTTSTEAARLLKQHLERALLDDLGGTVVSKVDVLEPAAENQGWANAALVVHFTNGERFGLEVCHFPQFPDARAQRGLPAPPGLSLDELGGE